MKKRTLNEEKMSSKIMMKNVKTLITIFLVTIIMFGCGNGNKQNQTEMTDQEEVMTNDLEENVESQVDKLTSTNGIRIGYVDYEKVNQEYLLTKEINAYIKRKTEVLNKKDEAAKLEYQTWAVEQEKKLATMLRSEQEELMKQDQLKSYQLQQDLAKIQNDFLKLQEDQNKKLNEAFSDFLARFSEENGFDFIVARLELGGAVLYANPDFDVTDKVIEGLNKEYQEKQNK